MQKHLVPEHVPAMPLSAYLRRAFPRIPASLLKETLKKRDVRVNGVKSDGQATVRGGDEVTLYMPDKYLTAPLRILYEDERMLAVEKPAGVPVDGDADSIGADTMLARLRAYCPTACLAHRLDAGTGGVLLAGKTGEGLAHLLDAFKSHRVEKTYLCLVRGAPNPPQADRKAFLLKDAASARVRILNSPAPGALSIETRYRLLETRGDTSLVEVQLVTGRTHQIRAHMSFLGYPLLGDDKYGDRAFNRAHHAAQIALWCARLRLDGLTFESRPPFA